MSEAALVGSLGLETTPRLGTPHGPHWIQPLVGGKPPHLIRVQVFCGRRGYTIDETFGYGLVAAELPRPDGIPPSDLCKSIFVWFPVGLEEG